MTNICEPDAWTKICCAKKTKFWSLYKNSEGRRKHTQFTGNSHICSSLTHAATGYVTHSLRFQRFVGQKDLMRRRRQFALKFRAWFGEWRGISVCFWRERGTIWTIFGWRDDDTILDSHEDRCRFRHLGWLDMDHMTIRITNALKPLQIDDLILTIPNRRQNHRTSSRHSTDNTARWMDKWIWLLLFANQLKRCFVFPWLDQPRKTNTSN